MSNGVKTVTKDATLLSAYFVGFHDPLNALMASVSFFSMAASMALDLSRSFQTGLATVWK